MFNTLMFFPVALEGRYQFCCSLASVLKFSKVAKQHPTNLQPPENKKRNRNEQGQVPGCNTSYSIRSFGSLRLPKVGTVKAARSQFQYFTQIPKKLYILEILDTTVRLSLY